MLEENDGHASPTGPMYEKIIECPSPTRPMYEKIIESDRPDRNRSETELSERQKCGFFEKNSTNAAESFRIVVIPRGQQQMKLSK